jgi:hypothetical protein
MLTSAPAAAEDPEVMVIKPALVATVLPVASCM